MRTKQSKIKQDGIRQELDGIAESNNGILKAVDVVEFAKDPKTALHSRFVWDDTQAGHQYRLIQARHIIKQIYVTIPEKENIEYQVFVSMPDDRKNPDGGYRTLVEVMSDEEMRKKLLAQAYAEFKLWQKKYQQLKELAPVFEKMDQVVSEKELVTA